MNEEIKTEIDRAKMNLDRLAGALDRVATDAELRAKLATRPMETLSELGFEFDEETKQEILKAIADEGKTMEKMIGIWSASAVKSGIRSGVKVGVTTAASTAVKSGVKSVISSGVEGLAVAAVAGPEGAGKPRKGPSTGAVEAKQKPAPKKGGRKKKE